MQNSRYKIARNNDFECLLQAAQKILKNPLKLTDASSLIRVIKNYLYERYGTTNISLFNLTNKDGILAFVEANRYCPGSLTRAKLIDLYTIIVKDSKGILSSDNKEQIWAKLQKLLKYYNQQEAYTHIVV